MQLTVTSVPTSIQAVSGEIMAFSGVAGAAHCSITKWVEVVTLGYYQLLNLNLSIMQYYDLEIPNLTLSMHYQFMQLFTAMD